MKPRLTAVFNRARGCGCGFLPGMSNRGFRNRGKTAVRLIAVHRTAIKKTAVGDKKELKTATATASAIINRG